MIFVHKLANGVNFRTHDFSKCLLSRYLRGQGGVPWVQIMENEFECLVVRRGDGGHFAEKFVKKYCS